MSIVLGITASHDASACVFRDGKLVAAVSEERISRIKCDGDRMPQGAIDECLRIAGIARKEVDHIASNYDHFAAGYVHLDAPLYKRLERAISAGVKRLRGIDDGKQVFLRSVQNDLRRTGSAQRPEEFLDVPAFLAAEGFRVDAQLRFFDHHLSHAAAAAFYSGYDKCLVITMDGEGDLDIHYTAGTFDGERLQCLKVGDEPGNSPGYFYMNITELLGFRPLRHEGKVLGLAAFGDPKPLYSEFKKALRLSRDGLGFDSDFNGVEDALAKRRAFLEKAIKGHLRENVAAAAQAVFEEAIAAICRNFLVKTGMRKLALNGGVFANVKLNQRLAALPECDSLFIFPGMSDAGNCVGAAVLLLDKLEPGFLAKNRHALDNVYWGTDPTRDEIKAELDRRGLKYEELPFEQVVEKSAQAMNNAQVVGWFQGAMEFGPRALGNRSMIAAPTDRSINTWLNERLERTEFMPFAPSTLAEYADEVYEGVEPGRHAAEFMTITYDVKKEWHERIPAVVHVDGTARPQLVRRDRNPKYWQLIERYRQLSGIPLVLNTSFNVHEEPIVRGPQEAAQALVDRRIDHLAIGNFWVSGKPT
ncbi:MAG: Decarbamoylnovobiocin carbamoyltransferase [Betaproteobacteria bacterium]|nr:Decarbamoylnovobiocin carbamoyltransferase [Betaproteobacteria bacterium]